MKRWLPLFLLLTVLPPFLGTAARGADIAKFTTDKAAIDHYLHEVQIRKPVTAEEYYDVVGLNTKDKSIAAKLKPLWLVLDLAFKNAGAFRSVKVIRVLEFGPMVRHAMYLVTYEKNVMAIDVWFVNSSQGWQLVNFKFPISDSASGSLDKAPAEFESGADGF